MRSFILLILISAFLFSCTGETAIEYNDTIIKPQLEIVAQMDSIFNPEITYENIQKHRQQLVKTAERGWQETQSLETYQGNESFKKSAVDYFKYVKTYFGETPGIDSILYKFNSPERLESLSDGVYNQTKQSFNEFLELENKLLAEQQRFAVEFNLKMDYRQPQNP